jgi:hypothetical protein
MTFEIRFPARERPELGNHKHVRKLLLAVEGSARKLVSDGRSIIGITSGEVPRYRITADFRGRHGFLRLNGNPVCSFADGNFHSFTYQAKMVQLEESLIESHIDPAQVHRLYRMVSRIVHYAEKEKFGCTIVVDLNMPPLSLAGQKLETPLDLQQPGHILLAQSLARVDGALHISADLKMHAFACLLDGRAVGVEDRARGARFNSALRFTSEHRDLIVIVVSADRPVSVIQEGVELNAECAWRPVLSAGPAPPKLEDWLAEEQL